VRASGGKCIPAFYRPLDKPTWSLLCATKPVFADRNRKTVRVMNIAEMLLLQTFPRHYNMSRASVLGSEHDRVRLVGNAVPPVIAKKFLSALYGS
jgi:site-specific DNA-cytosine methylase